MGGPTTTTKQQGTVDTTSQQQQQQNQQNQSLNSNFSSGTTTPNLPGWYQSFLQGMPGQFSGLNAQLGSLAGKQLYGPQQQANFQQQQNQQIGQSQSNLTQMLAKSGALNSGRAADSATQLQLGGLRNMGQYMSQVPQMNAQFQQSVLGQQGNNLANMANFKVPYGQTTNQGDIQSMLNSMFGNTNTSGSSMQDSNSTQTQQASGGLFQSLLGGLINAGMGALTGGLSNVMGGGSFTQPASVSPASTTPANFQNYNSAPPYYNSAPPYLPPPSINTGYGAGSMPPWMLP
jgi:hypothetical protein